MYIANILVRVMVTHIFLMDLPQTASEQTGWAAEDRSHHQQRFLWVMVQYQAPWVCRLPLLQLTHPHPAPVDSLHLKMRGECALVFYFLFSVPKVGTPRSNPHHKWPKAITAQHEARGPSLFLCSQLFSVIFHHFTFKCSALFGPCWPHLVSVLFSRIFCLHDNNAKNSQARCCPHWLFSFINDW